MKRIAVRLVVVVNGGKLTSCGILFCKRKVLIAVVLLPEISLYDLVLHL